ncbi:beta-carotene 15,15'-monooxygenase [Streptococcus sp. H49]|uniref:beta-carotene 15,15'-monooxygenase n=1 Tax=Streptococcus huangxiaojuni TaxID=3237239 RepID=UPI0034A1702A
MKKSIFKASFEESKGLVTQGKFVLTAGITRNNSPVHMGIFNRLFTLVIIGYFAAGIVLYGLLFAMPEQIGRVGEVRLISINAAELIHQIGFFLIPPSAFFYVLTFIFITLFYLPKKNLKIQSYFYFPFYFPLLTCTVIVSFYFLSAFAFNRFGFSGFLLQLVAGLGFIIVILYQGYRDARRRLYDEPRWLGGLVKVIGYTVLAVSAVLLVLSGTVFQGFVSDLNDRWYSYPVGLLLLPALIIVGYAWRLLVNQFIYQAYYIWKYPEEYKAYLKISDKEWYSKRELRRREKAAGSDKS